MRQTKTHQSSEVQVTPTLLNREQNRATHALWLWDKACAAPWPEANYRTLVNGFGAQVLRSGLLAAVAFARRYVDQNAADHMLKGLCSARVMSVRRLQGEDSEGIPPKGLLAALAGLDATAYMLATREVLATVLWLRRAVQEGEPEDAADAGVTP